MQGIYTEKVSLKDGLFWKRKGREGSELEKVILLSFDKTIEPLMCVKEMKGKVKVSLHSFKCPEKMTYIVQSAGWNYKSFVTQF